MRRIIPVTVFFVGVGACSQAPKENGIIFRAELFCCLSFFQYPETFLNLFFHQFN